MKEFSIKKITGVSRFSMLSNRQKSLFLLGFAAGFIMLVNTLYLLFASYIDDVGKRIDVLPVFYQIMLVTHLVLGLIFVLVGAGFVASHVLKIVKIRRRRPWMRTTGTLVISVMVLLLVSGLLILTESNSRENFWIFVSHQVLAFALLTGYGAHRLLSRVRPRFPFGLFWKKQKARIKPEANGKIPTSNKLRGELESAVVVSICVLLGVVEIGGNTYAAGSQQNEASDAKGSVNDNSYQFSPAGDPALESPFYPATTTTSTGDWLPSRIITHDDFPDLELFRAETEENGFAPSAYLGAQSCSRCHEDIVNQWATSAHRFSSFNNPFYRKSVELTREKIDKKASQFCGGCHDPAVMLAGNMVKEIDPLTPESQAGLTCLGCHAIDKVHGVVGNGNYNIYDETESPYIFDQAKSGLGREVHDYVLKAKPTVHKQRNLKPFFKKSEFCMACHKVNLDVPVNNYRWLRGQNEYDAWHNSGIAHNQPKTWYEPPTVRQCQDCHMPLEAAPNDVAADNGFVRSHRFLAANSALPALRGDTESIKRIEANLRDEKLRLEIFALRRQDGELIMNAGENKIYVQPGETIQVDVVVRNLNVGHMFPGGTNDSNEGWIDFKVSMGDEVVFHNGALNDNRHVDPAAHFYKAVLVDRHGERIDRRNASDIYATVYANVIAPSTSDIARYKFRIPEHSENKTLTIDARLMWRKFNRGFTEFVFEGKAIPDLPITEIETDTITVQLRGSTKMPVSAEQGEDAGRWMRYNDYGIGSVLDGDTRSALKAFAKVAELVPEKMDGYLNQARAHLTEGALENAEHFLRIASEKAPNEARIAFFWGVLLEKKGRFSEAVDAFKRTLQSYPQSRDTLVRLGRVYWLNSAYEDSIAAYKRVLEIDPEHAQAFYQLSLAYKARAANTLSSEKSAEFSALAEEYSKGFDKYKLDENAAKVTQKYREKNPYDNLMSQSIVIHDEG